MVHFIGWVNYFYNIYLERVQKPVKILGVFADIQPEHFPIKPRNITTKPTMASVTFH
jgi:hypothetical protein